jgi:hypothetical protein
VGIIILSNDIVLATVLRTESHIQKLGSKLDGKDDVEILDWITPVNYGPQQSDTLRRRQPETGRWFLNSEEYRAWQNGSKQTLFCPGIPGAGKTIVTSIVVDDLCNKFCNDTTAELAWIYCNFRQKRTVEDLTSSLLKQLIQCQPSMPAHLKDLYNHRNKKRTRPSIQELSKALLLALEAYTRAYIVVDALDECPVSDGCRHRFLSQMFNAQTITGVNILATSRFIPEIQAEFIRSAKLEIRATENDIQRYLDGYISQLPGFIRQSFDLQQEIKTGIGKAADGVYVVYTLNLRYNTNPIRFLLVQLHLDSLQGKTSVKAVRAALNNMVTGSDAYDHAYKDAMERIQGQRSGHTQLVIQVLSWITCAKRPLTVKELQHALSVEVDKSEFDEDNLQQVDMASICAGLVTIDDESSIIRLVHHTTQEYFDRTQNQWFPDAQLQITTTCIAYLSFQCFGEGCCPTDIDFEERLKSYPLYDYAARNWGHHGRAPSACPNIVSFL